MRKSILYILPWVLCALVFAACAKKITLKSATAQIETFSFEEHPQLNVIIFGGSITAEIPYDLINLRLTPIITVAKNGSVTPASGTKTDFGIPNIPYTVTSEDGYYTQTYYVNLFYKGTVEKFGKLSLPEGKQVSSQGDIASPFAIYKNPSVWADPVATYGFAMSNRLKTLADLPSVPADSLQYTILMGSAADTAYNKKNIFLPVSTGYAAADAAEITFSRKAQIRHISLAPSAAMYLSVLNNYPVYNPDTDPERYLYAVLEGFNTEGKSLAKWQVPLVACRYADMKQNIFNNWQDIDLVLSNFSDISTLKLYLRQVNMPGITGVFALGQIQYTIQPSVTKDTE